MKNTPQIVAFRPALQRLNYAVMALAISIYLLIPSITLGQKIGFTLRADHHEYLIGEHVPVWLEASADRMITIHWPGFTDTLPNGLRILNTRERDSMMGTDGVVQYSQMITVSAFDSGVFSIDSLAITFMSPGQSEHLKLYADPLTLSFKLPATADDQTLRDIRNPLQMPLTLKEIMVFSLWIVIAVAVIIIALRYIRKYRKTKSGAVKIAEPVQKGPNPWEKALQCLKALKQSDLMWVHGVKAYYIELSDILRIYIRDAHHVNAPELTTKQALKALRQQVAISETQHQRLTKILECADLVKFAKCNPSNDENTSIIDEAICFVTDTAPVHLREEETRKEEQI